MEIPCAAGLMMGLQPAPPPPPPPLPSYYDHCIPLDDVESITKRVHDDGFVCVSLQQQQQDNDNNDDDNVFTAAAAANTMIMDDSSTKFSIQQWSAWSQQHINDTFSMLYENGHVDFPMAQRETRTGTATATATATASHDNNDDHNNNGTAVVEYAMKQGIKHGFREIVMRSPGRYELSLLHCNNNNNNNNNNTHPPLQDIQNMLSPVICSILNAQTLSDLRLLHVSIVVASPLALEQKWHVDGGHVDLQHHLPCHCINIFIPLVDIHSENGPTELRPASHFLTRNLTPMLLAAKAKKTLRAPIVPTPLHAGKDVLIFDYRILHRGKANRSYHDRPILVLTYAKSWFKDALNFPTNSLYVANNNNNDDDDDDDHNNAAI